MIAFTVHEPPNPPSDRAEHAEALEFVRDGFSTIALAFAPLWLAAHRLWLGLAGYAALAGLLVGGLHLAGVPALYQRLALGLVHLLVALEGDSIRRWTLDRAGWRMIGSATGHTADDAERRFLDAWLPEQRTAPRTATRVRAETGRFLPSGLVGRMFGGTR